MGVSRLRLGESSSERDWESLNMTDVNRRIPSLRIPRDAIVALSLCAQNDCRVTSHRSIFSKRRRRRLVLGFWLIPQQEMRRMERGYSLCGTLSLWLSRCRIVYKRCAAGICGSMTMLPMAWRSLKRQPRTGYPQNNSSEAQRCRQTETRC